MIDKITEYFTDTHYAPVKAIAKATNGGPATTILSGMSIGKESAVWATLVIAGTISDLRPSSGAMPAAIWRSRGPMCSMGWR